ncbi:hypothetical protein IV102_29055 [bacterium]|nr:hypothetical protein [bacterium]
MFFGSSPIPQPGPPKSPSDTALSQLRQALKEECQNHPTLFMMENKKLYLTLLETYELQGKLQSQGQAPEAQALLMQELRHQLLGFALMQCLPEGISKQAAQQAQNLAAQNRGARTRASYLVSELEKHLEANPENEEKVSRWLMLQPLFRLSNHQPELFHALAQHFAEIARKIPDLLRSTNESLVTLMKTAPPS